MSAAALDLAPAPVSARPGRRTVGRDAIEIVHGGGPSRAVPSRDRRVLVSRLGVEAGEPTIGVARDGAVFFAALRDNTRVDVMRSTDRGESWDVVSPRLTPEQNAHLLSFDPYLYLDEMTGRLFTVDLTVECSLLSFSDDNGATWTTNPLACGRPVNDRQTLFAGRPVRSPTSTYENVLYYCWNDVGSSSCSKSLDGGLTFGPTGTPAFYGVDGRGDVCGGIHGHGVAGRDGAIYLPRELCGTPMLAISRDEGVSWSRVRVAAQKDAPRSTAPTVDVDAAGNIYYAWVANDGAAYLSTSRDEGRTWSRPLVVSAPAVAEANLLSLDVGSRGRVAFSYMGTEDASHPKTWNGYMTTTVDALSSAPRFRTVRVNPPAEPLKRGTCGPGRCGEEILDFIDVVVDREGRPWASFVDACDRACESTGLASGDEGMVATVIGGQDLRR